MPMRVDRDCVLAVDLRQNSTKKALHKRECLCRYTETARDPGQTPQQLFARLKATTQKGANRMQRIEGILRVIAQDSHSPARVQGAEESVAKLRAQLVELQQSEAALEGQVSIC